MNNVPDRWIWLHRLAWRLRLVDTVRLFASLFRRYPLRNEVSSTQKPLFIIGSGRSGNTLLRALLVAHGEYAIPPESYVLGTAIREYYTFSFLPWTILARLVLSRFESHPQFTNWGVDLQPLYSRLVALPPEERNLAYLLDGLYRFYAEEKQPSATRWGDKTPLNVYFLPETKLVFPGAQYINLVRDGRDVVASYLDSGLYQDLEAAAHRWLRSVNSARRFRSQTGPRQYLEVRYESLVTQTEAALQQVCQFLEISYRQEMLRYHEKTALLGDAHLPQYANLANPINARSISKWNAFFSAPQKGQLNALLGDTLKSLLPLPARSSLTSKKER